MPSPSPTPRATTSATPKPTPTTLSPLFPTATKSATPAASLKISSASATPFTAELSSTQPQLELKYNAKDHHFAVIISQAKEATYLLRYVTKQEAGEMEFALSNQAQATNQTVSGTHFAGTESSGQKVPHSPLRGTLELTATALDGKPFRRDYTFKLNALGEITALEIASHSSVLGESTESAEVATPSAKRTEPIRQSPTYQATVATTQPEWEGQAIGITVFGVVLVLVTITAICWKVWDTRKKKTITTPSSLVQPPELPKDTASTTSSPTEPLPPPTTS